MASVLLPFCSKIQQSAQMAGLSCYVSNETSLTVYSDSVVALRTWVLSNQITEPVIPYELTPRFCQCTTITPCESYDTHDTLTS